MTSTTDLDGDPAAKPCGCPEDQAASVSRRHLFRFATAAGLVTATTISGARVAFAASSVPQPHRQRQPDGEPVRLSQPQRVDEPQGVAQREIEPQADRQPQRVPERLGQPDGQPVGERFTVCVCLTVGVRHSHRHPQRNGPGRRDPRRGQPARRLRRAVCRRARGRPRLCGSPPGDRRPGLGAAQGRLDVRPRPGPWPRCTRCGTAKKLAVVHAVGQEAPTRSHFEAMEELERAAPDPRCAPLARPQRRDAAVPGRLRRGAGRQPALPHRCTASTRSSHSPTSTTSRSRSTRTSSASAPGRSR